MKAAIPLMMGLAGMLMKDQVKVHKIPSHKIETKKEVQQLSKSRIQKLKGKGARKNRGRNRHNIILFTPPPPIKYKLKYLKKPEEITAKTGGIEMEVK